MFVVICSVLGGAFLWISISLFLIPTRKVVLPLKVSPNTQVLTVRTTQGFSDLELENQIDPEEFIEKMKRGNLEIVIFPTSASIESFKTIGFGEDTVYIVKEKEWERWFRNLLSSNPKISPYITFPYTPYIYIEVKTRTDIKGIQPEFAITVKRNPVQLVVAGVELLVVSICIFALYFSHLKK